VQKLKMHGKKKHCSHEVYSVVEQMLNVLAYPGCPGKKAVK